MPSCSLRFAGPTMKRSATNSSDHDTNSAIMTLSACARPARANSMTPTPKNSAKKLWNHHSRRRIRFSRDGGGAAGSGAGSGLPTGLVYNANVRAVLLACLLCGCADPDFTFELEVRSHDGMVSLDGMAGVDTLELHAASYAAGRRDIAVEVVVV